MDEVKFGHNWVPDKPTLLCPFCGGNFLHHVQLETFERGEDAKKGMHTVVTADHVDVKYDSLVGNPSARRHGFKVTFRCEQCNNPLTLLVLQHKGETWVGWDNGDD